MTTPKIALSGLFICLSLTGVALVGTGCAGTTYHRSTGAYLDDKGITTRVKTALFRDPLVSGFDVHVNTFRGDVQLSGFVNSPEQKERAAEVAQHVAGVHQVTNNLEVKPGAVGGPAPAASGTSGTINEPVPERPAADNYNPNPPPANAPVVTPAPTPLPAAPPFANNFQLSTSDGRATLRGTVASEADKREIERRVRSMPGVHSVDNQLDVQAPR